MEKAFGGHDWRCNIDGCPGYKVTLVTPTAVDTVDVVFSITLTYRLGAGESARASVGYATGTTPPGTPPPVIPCCGDEPTTPLDPGPYRLASADGRATTTTLTWVARNLAAGGQQYRLYFHLDPDATFSKAAYTKRAMAVVETWSAGD
jgi:hypothetical protein